MTTVKSKGERHETIYKLIVILTALLALTGCGKRFDWNQKVTIEVQTPDGVKSGYAVQHVEWACCGMIKGMDGPSASSKVVGEAVVVDLGGKYLFALLQGDGSSFKGAADSIASFALWGADKALGTEEGLRHMTALPYGSSAVLEPGNLPMLVTFTDVNDPKTVQLVDPANLADSFGEGYALKSIKVEITNEKVTDGALEKVLGWIVDENPIFVSSKDYPFGHPLRRISKFSFKSGVN